MRSEDTPESYGSRRCARPAVCGQDRHALCAVPELAEQQQLRRPAKSSRRAWSSSIRDIAQATRRRVVEGSCRGSGSAPARRQPIRDRRYGSARPDRRARCRPATRGWVEPPHHPERHSSGPNRPCTAGVPHALGRVEPRGRCGPGKHLSDIPSDGLERTRPNPADGNIALQIDYAARPALADAAFGGTYRFSAEGGRPGGQQRPVLRGRRVHLATPEVTDPGDSSGAVAGPVPTARRTPASTSRTW